MNVLVRILGFQKKKLGHDQVGNMVIDGSDQKDDTFLEQPGIDIVGTFAPGRLFDDHGYKVQRPWREVHFGLIGHLRLCL